MQILECREDLKNGHAQIYTYGYYLPEHKHAKRQFFKY